MKGPFVFRQDESMHWYRVPAGKADEFDRLMRETREAGRGSDEFYEKVNEFEDKFGQYRTGGGPEQVEFYVEE